MLHARMTTLAFKLSELYPLACFSAVLYTTQNLLRITFIMSCQHFPPKHNFKFLVNQCWKLIQRCILKVSLSFLSPLFQHMHRSMSTLKICHSRKRVDGTSKGMPILTLV